MLAVIGALINKKIIAGMASIVIILIAGINISSHSNKGTSKF
jgi:hypothetical protein